MNSRLKRVTSLGLGLVISGGLLTACDAADAPAPDGPVADAPTPAESQAPAGSHAPMGQMGEGGEGEGGVSIGDAYTSAVVFNSSLAIAAAHVIAARDAHAAGRVEAAAEMFAHPVSEVLLDMEPVFLARGVAPFDALFTEASLAVLEGESSEQIAERAGEILAMIGAAQAFAPDDESTPADIAAGVAVDQIDRAADMYRIAQRAGAYGPYLDGYGFFRAAEMAYRDQADAVSAADSEAAERIEAALALLGEAYPSAAMPEALDADRAALSSASAQAMLAVLN